MDASQEDTNKVINFLQYRQQKQQVENLLSEVDVSKLGPAEQGKLIAALGQLVKQQSELLSTMMTDLALLSTKQLDMESQFTYVAGQAYLSLEMMKDKGLCSAEELEGMWGTILKEKIDKDQEPVGELSLAPGLSDDVENQ